ncbi:MAG: hypothetical protein ABIK31_05785 [candidate division WOR-3 bacterium]
MIIYKQVRGFREDGMDDDFALTSYNYPLHTIFRIDINLGSSKYAVVKSGFLLGALHQTDAQSKITEV